MTYFTLLKSSWPCYLEYTKISAKKKVLNAVPYFLLFLTMCVPVQRSAFWGHASDGARDEGKIDRQTNRREETYSQKDLLKDRDALNYFPRGLGAVKTRPYIRHCPKYWHGPTDKLNDRGWDDVDTGYYANPNIIWIEDVQCCQIAESTALLIKYGGTENMLAVNTKWRPATDFT